MSCSNLFFAADGTFGGSGTRKRRRCTGSSSASSPPFFVPPGSILLPPPLLAAPTVTRCDDGLGGNDGGGDEGAPRSVDQGKELVDRQAGGSVGTSVATADADHASGRTYYSKYAGEGAAAAPSRRRLIEAERKRLEAELEKPCPSCLYVGVLTCAGLAGYFVHLAHEEAASLVGKKSGSMNRPFFLAVAVGWAAVGAYRWRLG